MMRSSSLGSGSRRLSNYNRNYDLPADQDSRDQYRPGGAMLPIFLNDHDLVELTLELDHDSIVVCSVTAPTGDQEPAAANGFLPRSFSATSRLLSWLRSSSRTSSEGDQDPTISARDSMKMKAKLVRTKSSAQRALGGLRFISKTTGTCDANELWKNVETRFDSLAEDGLLSREDFGECIGEFVLLINLRARAQ